MKTSFFFLSLLTISSAIDAQMHNQATVYMKLNKDSLLEIVNNPRDDSGKVKAFHMLGTMTAGNDAVKAIEYTKAGICLGRQIHYDRGIASCMLSTSYCYSLLNRIPEALRYIDSTIILYKKMERIDRLSFCYKSRAEYKQKLGRLAQSIRDCDTALYYAEKTNSLSTRKYLYRLMADAYYSQGDYKQSEEYYRKSFDEHFIIKDSIQMADLLNGLGKVKEKRNNYTESISDFKRAIAISLAIKQVNNVSEFYNSLGKVLLKKGEVEEAGKAVEKAVAYAKAQKNNLHLATARQTLSSIYSATDSTNAAIQNAEESYVMASELDAKTVQQNAADVLAENYLKKGDYKNAFIYMRASKLLNDSLAADRYSKDVTDVQTKFKLSEKDKEILLLNKNKELQQQKIKQQRLVTIGLAVLAIFSLTGIWLYINRNRLRQRMKELELRNQIAADLHDEVGSSLSSIHMLSQMATRQGSDTKQNDVLKKMSSNAKETMDKMGDIVWMIKPGESEASSLKQRMERFAYEICETKNIVTEIDIDELEKVKLTMEQRKNIYLIFKESLNNAVKYSGTEKAGIKVMTQNKELVLLVKDHGKGFEYGANGKGNGLDNMKNRASELNGKLEMITGIGDGTTVRLTVPL